jgi:hypothetical protein
VIVAALVALSPADRRHSIFAAFATWVAAGALMFILAPHVTAPHQAAILQAAL